MIRLSDRELAALEHLRFCEGRGAALHSRTVDALTKKQLIEPDGPNRYRLTMPVDVEHRVDAAFQAIREPFARPIRKKAGLWRRLTARLHSDRKRRREIS
jgi:hypothetical protein